jgi:hypothetical protein
MKIRFFFLTAMTLAGFATGTYAAKKDLDDQGISSLSYHEVEHKISNNNFYEPGSSSFAHHEDKLSLIDSDFDDHIKTLSEHHHNEHFYYQMAQSDNDEYGHHDNHDWHHGWDPGNQGGNGDHLPGVSAVPVPAALWLFGSALLGLVGAQRKRA